MKFKRIFALLMALSLLVFFAGCETKEVLNDEKPTEVDVENEVAEEESDEISIADWEGEWNSLGAYLEDEGLQDTFAHMAEEHGESVEEVKAEIAEAYGLPFGAMKIEGNQVTFIDGKAEDGKEIETVTYNFVKSHEMSHGGHSFFWHIFEAEGDATYKILFMMPVHGEESVAHYHMRFGNDIGELMAKEEWYPTFVKPSTTTEQLAEVFAHHDHDHDHDHDHEHEHEHGDEAHDHDHDHEHAAPERVVLDDVALEDWAGEWNSMSAYLNDEELQEALEAHAKAEGKTVDEIKAEYLEKYKIDYETMVFDGDTITFYDARLDKGGQEIAKSKYTYVESYKVQHGKHDIEWHVFEGEEGAKFKYLMMMPVHGEETLAHFHMRLGDDIEKMLEEDDWFPTFIKPTTTYDQLADVFGPHEH